MSVLVKKGDTLIEVMMSISIFAFVALLAINMMNDGMNTAQRTLEATMARNEMAAQADALRYVHNSYISQYQNSGGFTAIWNDIKKNVVSADLAKDDNFDINNIESCSSFYNDGSDTPPITKFKSFVLNPRLLLPQNVGDGKEIKKYLGKSYNDVAKLAINSANLAETDLYPRLRFAKIVHEDGEAANDDNLKTNSSHLFISLESADGLWINGVKESSPTPSYYDFYVRTCWQAAGVKAPSTLTTIVRLYNPEGV